MPSFKKIFTGGAPVFPRTLIAIEAVAPEARVEALYGSTEAEPISHIAAADISPADLDAVAAGKGLPAGRPVEEIDLRIVRVDEFPSAKLTEAEFLTYCLGPECAGEILVSGAHVLKGYLGGYGDEETKVKVGSTVWHRTGDAGYLDKKGRLWLLGRWESRIVREGEETLFPFAIECVASGHPAVEHAALSIRGGKPVLVVQIRRGHSAPTLAELGLANAGLDGIFAVSRMPLDLRHNAKINYPALAKLLGGGM